MKSIDIDALSAFCKKPYVILPKAKNEYWIIVPRYVRFQLGWLERQTESYNIFVVNKYIDWIAPLPHDLKARLGLEGYLSKAVIHARGPGESSILEVGDGEIDRAWDKYKKRLTSKVRGKDDQFYIKRGTEWDLLAELIQDGMLPFEPKPIDDKDLREDLGTIELRDYQKRAWDALETYGAIGVFWAPGAGKTFLSLYAGNRIKGSKLVVVPMKTLVEQWNSRIRKYATHPQEWEVKTYQYITMKSRLAKYQKKKYKVIIFDEVHHLPSTHFSKLAHMQADYRIGLSASPYREDGRTEYIFALTGYPVGLKWRELISLGIVQEPDVKVYVYNTISQKRADLSKVVYSRTGKILIYCDSIDLGHSLKRDLGVEFVHGGTKNRMEILQRDRVVIASRVADEGISLPDLDIVVEYDFLFGSRRQEAQRAGRLMHGEGKGEHIIMMTEDELNKYEKRLYGLEEQGFRIRFERR